MMKKKIKKNMKKIKENKEKGKEEQEEEEEEEEDKIRASTITFNELDQSKLLKSNSNAQVCVDHLYSTLQKT
jgi:hypothetical protein